MADRQNRQRGVAFRHAVAAALQGFGVDGAVPRGTAGLTMAQAADRGALVPDIEVPGSSFFIATRSDISPALGPAIDSAQQGAAIGGRKHGVLIQFRPGRGVRDSYAVLTIEALAEILRIDSERPDLLRAGEEVARIHDQAEV